MVSVFGAEGLAEKRTNSAKPGAWSSAAEALVPSPRAG